MKMALTTFQVLDFRVWLHKAHRSVAEYRIFRGSTRKSGSHVNAGRVRHRGRKESMTYVFGIMMIESEIAFWGGYVMLYGLSADSKVSIGS